MNLPARGFWAAPLAWCALFAGLFGADLVWPETPAATVAGFAIGFLGLSAVVVVGALGAARWDPGRRGALLSLAVGALLAALGAALVVPFDALVRGAGLLVLAVGVGAALGGGVEKPGHLWPLAIVALGADIWSVTSAEGFTNQVVVEGEGPPGLLHLIVLSIPVPGLDVEPVLGIGDVLFTGLFLGAVVRHRLPVRRALVGLMIGFALCLVALMVLQLPLPALPFIGVAATAALGRSARPAARDMLLAVGFVGLLFVLRAAVL